jgi:hypothetical protein
MDDNLSELVIIGTVNSELKAHVIKSRLESESIPVLLQYESVSIVCGINIGGLAEVKILVPQEFIDDAKKIIGRKSGFIPIPIQKNKRPRSKCVVTVVIHRTGVPKLIVPDDGLEYLREVLSCPTCRFDNEEAWQKGLPWCNAPHPPDIENNYCNTFEQLNK